MRILYVTACMPFGTAEAFLTDELRELLARHEVLIVPRSPGKGGQNGGSLVSHAKREGLLSFQVITTALSVFASMPGKTVASAACLLRSQSLAVAYRNLAVLPKALWLAKAARAWKADHIHCHWAGTTATMALIASRLSGIPWSLTAHRSDIVGNNLLADKARSAGMVRVISQDGQKMMTGHGIKAGSKLRVLPMGVTIPPDGCCKRPKAVVLLCPADLLEVKGHRFLLHAWRLLRDRGIQGELWLAGEGKLRCSLEKLAAHLQISDTVRFLGTINHALLLELYAQGRVSAVVLASVDLGGGCREGIPVALVEAMSYGIPVIATTTGGIPELIIPGTGLLAPPGDPIALAGAIQRILQDDSLSEQIGSSARRHIMETRDVVRIVDELEAWFRGQFEPPLAAIDGVSEGQNSSVGI
jgi:colanic acid/amylovoran biosynthesis glycosyltransferase